jgi:hypothetical protein
MFRVHQAQFKVCQALAPPWTRLWCRSARRTNNFKVAYWKPWKRWLAVDPTVFGYRPDDTVDISLALDAAFSSASAPSGNVPTSLSKQSELTTSPTPSATDPGFVLRSLGPLLLTTTSLDATPIPLDTATTLPAPPPSEGTLQRSKVVPESGMPFFEKRPIWKDWKIRLYKDYVQNCDFSTPKKRHISREKCLILEREWRLSVSENVLRNPTDLVFIYEFM